ncbi:GNAT family N-acetyltransferase [Ahniella affigens]|uniref:GNAT family N-acetyltransferase n=1 Tax=Ahniella affigens TaxID=2021234 RepID=A0A2P1PSJ7_9GAMM|nr:GNAT family N-acetyltransferase [Ahniella affigens]AVP97813.1 GNAT family N-acetyltransferase [Ahniella affigens]
MNVTIRPIEAKDDPIVAAIIRRVMPEFGADGPGFAIHDPEVDFMSQSYGAPRSAYFVVEAAGTVVGGGGVAGLAGDGTGTICELRKMYFLPEARGLGAGRALIERCLAVAKAFGYQRCYLETLEGMHAAQKLYRANGFTEIAGPLGNTGHFSCDRFFVKDLSD